MSPSTKIAVIIGPNGAGKSTLLKTIFALTARSEGGIAFADKDITGLKTAQLVPLGISMVPQSRNVFPTLSVDENLDVGTYAAPPKDKAAVRESVLALFPDLRDKLGQAAGELSGGRAAADGGDGPGVDERADNFCFWTSRRRGCRRPISRSSSDLLLDIRKRGRDYPDGRAERQAGAGAIADNGHVLVGGRNFVSGTGRGAAQRRCGAPVLPRGGLPA